MMKGIGISIAIVCLIGCQHAPVSAPLPPPPPLMTYGLPHHAPDWLKERLEASVNAWNQALQLSGKDELVMVSYGDALIRVDVQYVDDPRDILLERTRVHCQGDYLEMSQCVIRLLVPSAKMMIHHVDIMMPLYLDKPAQVSGADYLRMAITDLQLLHEIGHTLGLAHSLSSECVMHPQLGPRQAICPKSAEIAREKLKKLRKMQIQTRVAPLSISP